MQVFLCDDIADNVGPDFDGALFVIAPTAAAAAVVWRNYYDRGELPCRVTPVPTIAPSDHDKHLARVIEWDTLKQVIV